MVNHFRAFDRIVADDVKYPRMKYGWKELRLSNLITSSQPFIVL